MSTVVIPVNFPESFQGIKTNNIERRLKIKLPEFSESEIEELIVEYKRFLLLFLLYGDTSEDLVPGYFVDEVWHEHILHSKQYQDDCMKIFGGQMLHHFPSENDDGGDMSGTFTLYEKTFCQEPPAKYWLNRQSVNSNVPCCGNGGGNGGGNGSGGNGYCNPGR